ncbi:GntR family transcriptional regulator [Streptomyces parvulus]|uniref:GntR family transcriptional regulator n=1 Tax=Streptomyces parvulus TaxID=146923 RepID=UPI00210D6740|nr:GntR family transcriptional regulator [Streptomyces parvulus]MCQ4194198.1 GntR family transcriptional regulator [Streptomyces parvulus]
MAASEGFMPESERVTRHLRDEIVDGVRRPGSRLVERELAEALGVSRLPVREALRTLVSEGLVTPRPRTWAVVREFTTSDIADLDEVRSGLETLAFRLAAVRHTREGLERLRATVDAELDAARADDAVAARRSAADFHQTVISLAANELLNELERVLRSRLRWLMGQHDDLMAVALEHEALYRAIAERDVERVQELVLHHQSTSRSAALSHHAREQARRDAEARP